MDRWADLVSSKEEAGLGANPALCDLKAREVYLLSAFISITAFDSQVHRFMSRYFHYLHFVEREAEAQRKVMIFFFLILLKGMIQLRSFG